ncbi:hypothetical protein [Actinospongicola halichondriae]|uniref:hypothetical protein n=1 Tax=Actinospongicola halichondriae TaxID=3236844 RepID=UPI003D518BA6
MRRSIVLVVLVSALAVGGCSDDAGGDLASFCAAVDELEANDPFADLDVASPGEMRTAFDQLSEGVERIADAAPDDLRPSADRYADTVDALIDHLRGADFDPRNLDTLRYRTAAADYEEAAVSVENAATAACDQDETSDAGE